MKRVCILLMTILLSSLPAMSVAKEPDWSAYEKLLSNYVKPGVKNGVNLNSVDYHEIKASPLLRKAVAKIEAFKPSELSSKEERLAFYINAYNIYAIKMVVDHLPLKSIKDVGSFFSSVWKKDIGRIDGQVISLDEIEHDILRPMGEPRIHMAIVCASVSCPDLRQEPYTAKNLSHQLDDQSKSFLRNAKKGLNVNGNELYISKIFDWFEDDFDAVGGVKQFVLSHRQSLHPNVKIKSYLPYDWNLNSTK